jgi:hypothetical protein
MWALRDDKLGPGVWFFFCVGTGEEELTADTCDSRTNFDTKLSIFSLIARTDVCDWDR